MLKFDDPDFREGARLFNKGRYFIVPVVICAIFFSGTDDVFADKNTRRRHPVRNFISRIRSGWKPSPANTKPPASSIEPAVIQPTLGLSVSAGASWDFRDGIDGSDWNVRLIPIQKPHPGRQLHLPPEQHLDYYLQNSQAIALTPEGLRFTVRPGDAVVGGDRRRIKERSEIGRVGLGEGEKGQTCEYSMRFKLADGGTIPTGSDFMFLTQSHSSRDVDFPGGWTMFVGVSGKNRLKFVYGLNDRRTQLQTKRFAASFGEWHDLTVRVYWSDQREGWAEVYLDGAQAVPRVSGPNMPTADAMEWKFGIYRGHQLATTDVLTVQTAEHKVL